MAAVSLDVDEALTQPGPRSWGRNLELHSPQYLNSIQPHLELLDLILRTHIYLLDTSTALTLPLILIFTIYCYNHLESHSFAFLLRVSDHWKADVDYLSSKRAETTAHRPHGLRTQRDHRL